MALKLTYKVYELPLRHPFTISRYTVNVQKTVVACISDDNFSGYGEATANPYYNSTVEKLSASLESIIPLVSAATDIHPEAFWQMIAPELQHDYFALCAADIAYWDYYARKQGRALRSYWSDGSEPLPPTSYTIGLDSVAAMIDKIREMPWPLYKIKLGTDRGIEIVASLRKITDSPFRVDANAAWTAEEAIENAKILRDLNVEFIEQPLPASDTDGMRSVYEKSVLPVVADESCQREEDVRSCDGMFHGINIKLMKCGGITPALRMISDARSRGLKVMAGCMTESTVGISALVQLAPLLDYLDADGAMLLANDTSEGARFEQGKIIFPEGYGSGAEIRP